MYNLEELSSLGLKYTDVTYNNEESYVTVVIFDKLYESDIIGFVMTDLLSSMLPLVLTEPNDDSIDFASLCCAKNGSCPRISFDFNYMPELQALTNEVLTIIFHELGHLINGDLTDETFDFDNYHTERLKKATNNAVLSLEASADEFAVNYLGSDKVIAGLMSIIEKTESYDGYENVGEAISELKQRIYRIQNL